MTDPLAIGATGISEALSLSNPSKKCFVLLPMAAIADCRTASSPGQHQA